MILALTDRRYLRQTIDVVGDDAHIWAFPPMTAGRLEPADLEGYDLVYIDLHGEPSGGYLYTFDNTPALSFQTVRQATLESVLVIATTCYLPQSPFLSAFQDAGAAVIAGDGPNYGEDDRGAARGAQLLAQSVIRRVIAGESPKAAFVQARQILRYSWRRWLDPRATADTLKFKFYGGPDDKTESVV
jgi:hypothetical protein